MRIQIDSNKVVESMQSIPSLSVIGKNTILLKNMHLYPQIIKISLDQGLIVKVSHNNSYQYSQISSIKKKFIFSIQQLDIESDPLQEGQQYEFSAQYFTKIGEYKLTCINIPKISSKIIVQNCTFSLQQQCEDQLLMNLKQHAYNSKKPIKLTLVQQQPQEQIVKQQSQQQLQQVGISSSKSDLQQYERILTEQDDSKSDTLQNKYLNYFKQQFKLWRNFFQQQQLKQKQHSKQSEQSQNKSKILRIDQVTQNKQNINKTENNSLIQTTKNNTVIQMSKNAENTQSNQNNSITAISKNNQNLQSNKKNQNAQQSLLNNQYITPQKSIITQKQKQLTPYQLTFEKHQKKKHQLKQKQIQLIQKQKQLIQKQNQLKQKQKQFLLGSSPQPILINHHSKKLSLKQKHTTTKNLSLSQVKQVDPNNKNKSQYEYDSDHSSSQQSKKGISIPSQLYSHQQIIDRNNDYEQINSGRKQMKKTNSEYGFNIMRSQQQKQPTLDKISVFGKQQQIHLPQHHSHSRRSNHQTTPSTNKNNKKSYSRISMSRTQTNSPALKQYKKDNNFLTWATQWAKQKQYKPVIVEKMNDHHLIKQFNIYMKNKFKVTQFMYC